MTCPRAHRQLSEELSQKAGLLPEPMASTLHVRISVVFPNSQWNFRSYTENEWLQPYANFMHGHLKRIKKPHTSRKCWYFMALPCKPVWSVHHFMFSFSQARKVSPFILILQLVKHTHTPPTPCKSGEKYKDWEDTQNYIFRRTASFWVLIFLAAVVQKVLLVTLIKRGSSSILT